MKLRDMETFTKVVSEGSITAAADLLDVPKSTVSRRLKSLESDLGVRLLDRTTHRIALTESGQIFLERAQEILSTIAETRSLFRADTESARGKLTLCAPTVFYKAYLSPHMAEFLFRYPGVELELLSYESQLPNNFERVDMVVHVGVPPDISRVGKPIANLRGSYYASREYLEAFGEPASLAGLAGHRYIDIRRTDRQLESWHNMGRAEKSKAQVIQVDTTAIAHGLCVHGAGIAFLPSQLAKEGDLIELFGAKNSKDVPIYVLYASRQHTPARVRAMIDFMNEKFTN